MNKLRGDFDSIRLAELILDLKTNHNMSETELADALGFTQEELTGYDALVNFDFEDYKEQIPTEVTDEELPNISEFSVSVTQEQHLSIEEGIRLAIVKEFATENGEALSLICKYFTTHYFSGKIKAPDIKNLKDTQQEEAKVSSIEELSDILGDEETN